jgi:hypothetical protein
MADRISRRAARPAETAAASRDITPAGFPAREVGWITDWAVNANGAHVHHRGGLGESGIAHG